MYPHHFSSMRSVAYVLCSLAIIGSARRVQSSSGSFFQDEAKRDADSMKARGVFSDFSRTSSNTLQSLLLALNSAAITPSTAARIRMGKMQMRSLDEPREPTSVLDQDSTRRQFVRTSAAAALSAALTAASPMYAAGTKNSVYFSNVKDGDTVPSKFTYKFEVTGYSLSPAADGLKEGTGHHHMIIDEANVEKGQVIPMDATHKHYGKAQTEGELELEPGKHKITLQFANAAHESYGKEFAQTITVNVKD
mmetsp:Transcript_70944/g.112120  ORF Transcript_70944/g.112120 Transcript_70944/m.112120 type:complete len:250 (+) Transcript_70944:26-775(+)